MLMRGSKDGAHIHRNVKYILTYLYKNKNVIKICSEKNAVPLAYRVYTRAAHAT